MTSWSNNTTKSYNPYLKQWLQFINNKQIQVQDAVLSTELGIEFLTHLFVKKKLGYSAVNSARSALSTIMVPQNNTTFGKQPLVKRLLKGMFRIRPALPRYTVTYDVAIVLNYLKMWTLEDITLKKLSLKTATLLCLLTSQRDQSLHELHLDYFHVDDTQMVFYIPAMLKTTRPTFHTQPLVMKRYPDDKNLCVVETVLKYIQLTQTIRDTRKLFISQVPPHKQVTTETISRWVKMVLKEAGIDTKTFTSGSTRSAATSCAKARGLSVHEIQEAAGWTNARTFAKHYDKHIKTNFGVAVMGCLQP